MTPGQTSLTQLHKDAMESRELKAQLPKENTVAARLAAFSRRREVPPSPSPKADVFSSAYPAGLKTEASPAGLDVEQAYVELTNKYAEMVTLANNSRELNTSYPHKLNRVIRAKINFVNEIFMILLEEATKDFMEIRTDEELLVTSGESIFDDFVVYLWNTLNEKIAIGTAASH